MERLTAGHMVFGGYAISRMTNGAVVLASGVLPGEEFTARVTTRKGVRFGVPEEIITPSAHRVPAQNHPGLDYSHVSYEQQLVYKQDVFTDSIRRVREHFPANIPITRSPREWQYRNTVQPAVAATGLGYRQAFSHDVVTLAEDPVAMPGIQAAWRALGEHLAALRGVREVVLRTNRAGETLVALVATRQANAYQDLAHQLVTAGLAGVSYAPFDPRGRFRGGSERLAGERSITETYGKIPIALNTHAFTQVNPDAAEMLYERVRTITPNGRRALELYAGTGMLSMNVADRFEAVDAFEIDRSATTRGKRAAKAIGVDNITFHTGDVARFTAQYADADVIIVDPPRAGLSAPVRDAITASSATTLVYVSCDPATFARDTEDFLAHHWRVSSAELFDFFPHTHHVESLVVFQRTEA